MKVCVGELLAMCDQCHYAQLNLNNVLDFDNEWQVCQISITNWVFVHDVHAPTLYIQSINLQKNYFIIKEVSIACTDFTVRMLKIFDKNIQGLTLSP